MKKETKKTDRIEKIGNFEKVKLESEKIQKREVKIRILKMGLLISALFLIIIYSSSIILEIILKTSSLTPRLKF